jgi:hypothetical protein
MKISPPHDDNFNPNAFHFHGFGQPVNNLPPPQPGSSICSKSGFA